MDTITFKKIKYVKLANHFRGYYIRTSLQGTLQLLSVKDGDSGGGISETNEIAQTTRIRWC